jgi:hypothetical protein
MRWHDSILMVLMKKELFVCDDCGERKRLNSMERHFCENPTHRRAVEMRPSRTKKPVQTTQSPARSNWRCVNVELGTSIGAPGHLEPALFHSFLILAAPIGEQRAHTFVSPGWTTTRQMKAHTSLRQSKHTLNLELACSDTGILPQIKFASSRKFFPWFLAPHGNGLFDAAL